MSMIKLGNNISGTIFNKEEIMKVSYYMSHDTTGCWTVKVYCRDGIVTIREYVYEKDLKAFIGKLNCK